MERSRFWGAGTGFTQRIGMTFEPTPWFEGSFRYIGTKGLLGAQEFQGDTYYDRSFGIRIRLQQETDGWPDITLGINDVVGTSIEAGEYIAASKHLGSFDVTAGLGWGRLAGTEMFTNPLTYLSQSFATRSVATSAGQVHFGEFFHGPDMSLFGGVSWATPLEGLSLQAEYSSDTYSLETTDRVFKPSTQFNFGASYNIFENTQIGVAWFYGNTIMGRLSFMLDPGHEQTTRIGSAVLPPNIRTDAEHVAALRQRRWSPTHPF